MSSTESTIRVPIRDLQVRDTLPADSLTVLPVPIAAIGGVTNPSPTSISTREETDDELRARVQVGLRVHTLQERLADRAMDLLKEAGINLLEREAVKMDATLDSLVSSDQNRSVFRRPG